MAGFPVGKDALAVYKNVEHPQASHADSGFDPKLFSNEFFQAHGPNAVFSSNEAAFNDDSHAALVLLEESLWGVSLKILRTIHTGATNTCAGLVRKAGLLPSMK